MAYPSTPDVPANTAAPVDGQKASYSAVITDLASVASATDIFTITGSATKTIRVTRIEVSGVQTTGGAIDVVLLKRSTANSAGTSTTPTPTAYDSANASATAVVRAYTANPTTGTLIGKLRVDSIFTSASTAAPGLLAYNFGDRPSQCPVLRGVNEVLAVNLNGVTVTGGSFDISVEFTEE